MRRHSGKTAARVLSAVAAVCLSLSLFGCVETPSAGEGRAAVYIYMCGSDLETKQSAATRNLAEILGADIDESVSVVIETGGAQKWRGYDISSDFITRYEAKDGVLLQRQLLANASMGDGQTLSDFIGWCTKEYPAEKTALILWDHGGGASGEVCYDENYAMDALTPEELRGALEANGAHFDLIGLDACLMATDEMAALLKDHADFLLASEEIEPSGGWDYAALAEGFSSGGTVEETCRAVADAYMRKCDGSGGGDMATLSLFDLKEYGEFSAAFDAFAQNLRHVSEERFGNFNIVRATEKACKFGAAARDEGASNLIDLYGFAASLARSDASASALMAAIEKLVPYRVSGAGREGVGGVSLYYPLRYDPNDLNAYLRSCSSEPYKTYLAEIYGGDVSCSIGFSDAGSIGEDGSFHIALTQESRKYLKSVEFSLLGFSSADSAAPYEMVQLGIDNDLKSDWDGLTFRSNFRGVWLALDGAYLNYSVIENNDEYIIFSAPVKANGVKSNLRFMFVWDDSYFNGGYYKIIGLWNGLDENNLADKQITPLKEGDEITVLRKAVDPASDRTIEEAALSEGETVVIGGDGGKVAELPLGGEYYRYVFIVTDIFGNRFYSDTAGLEMKYTYDELLADPLPDGEYAAEVMGIEWDSYWGAVG